MTEQTYYYNRRLCTLAEVAEMEGRDLARLQACILRGRALHQALADTMPTYRTMYELNGVSKSLTDWARAYGMRLETVSCRMSRGIPLEEALTRSLPPRKRILLKVPVNTHTGGYQQTFPHSSGTGLGSIAVERGHPVTKSKTEKQPAEAGKSA